MTISSFTDQNFADEVLRSPIPVLVLFTASWNGPSNVMRPIVEKLGADFPDKVKVGTVDIDDAPDRTKQYGVHSVPACLVFKERSLEGRHAGLTDRETLLKLLGIG